VEFEVERITIPQGIVNYRPLVVDCASLVLFASGERSTVDFYSSSLEEERSEEQKKDKLRKSEIVLEGSVLFIPAGLEISISTGEAEAVFYRTHVNLG
jgi:hypothetical protein